MRTVFLWITVLLAAWASGCKSRGDSSPDGPVPQGGKEESLFRGAGNEDRLYLKNPPQGKAPPAQVNPRPPSRIQLVLGGQKLVRKGRDDFWWATKPVPSDTMATFTTTLSPVSRVMINIFESTHRGDLVGGNAISIIDPGGRTLAPGKAFKLSEPRGCLIWKDRTLRRVPFKPGQYYRMRLRVEAGPDAEVLSVVFRIR